MQKEKTVHDICVSLNNELEQKIYLPRLLTTYGFKEKVVINFKLRDFDDQTGKLMVCCNEENSINIDLPEKIYRDVVIYCSLNKYQEREHLFTKSNGTCLTPDSMFGTLKPRMKKMDVANFTPTSVALYGVANLIEEGLTLAEIKLLTGFETQKIDDVAQYLLTDEDAEELINRKIRGGVKWQGQ